MLPCSQDVYYVWTRAHGGAYDRWTLEDIRGQYRRAENFVCLHPVSVVSRDDVRAEVLKVLLGNIDSEARAQFNHIFT